MKILSGLGRWVNSISQSRRSPEYIVSKPPKPEEYNAARIYTGVLQSDDGWGGQYDTRFGYKVKSGKIYAKRLRPMEVTGGFTGRLETYVIYPETDTAVIEIFSKSGLKTEPIFDEIKLRKCGRGEESIMYKQRI